MVNKIRMFFRTWYLKIKLKLKLKHATLTPYAKCFLRYILDYYVNESINEPAEVYEREIADKINKIMERNHFIYGVITRNAETKTDADAMFHYYCVMSIMASLLTMCNEEEQQEWFNYIEDEHRREVILNYCVKVGAIIKDVK